MRTIETIKRIRSERHLTQQDVADAVGIARQAYVRIESGKHSTSIDMIERIAHALDCDVMIVKKDNQ
jgi:transcriptional regulator with XRE-family HTH domain